MSSSPPRDGADAGVWTVFMVERAAAVFAELPRLPAYDRGRIAERVAAWYRFVDVVAEGAFVVEAAPLAADIVRGGVQFLAEHPEHVLVSGATWDVDDVEGVARWFGAVSDEGGADVVARVLAFERIVRSGLIDDDAMPLARALLELMDSWRAAR